MTILDDVIGYFNPTSKLSRLRARRAISIMQRGYDGAKTGRRSGGWITPSTSANAEISVSLTKLRDRSRDLVRNNPYASKAMRVLVSNAVGVGINPSIKNKKILGLWKQSVKEFDADGQLDFYGLQRLIVRTVFESGECLVRFRYRKAEDGLLVPLQIQVLEPDYIDSNKTENLRNGGYIQNGIEYDAIGKRVAYWLFKQHPGEVSPIMNGIQSSRIDAKDIIHIYEKLRPGQARGVPIFSSVMMMQNDLDEYEEATLVRKAAEACIAAFVQSDDEGASIGITSTEDNRRIEELAPGMVEYLSNGESVTFNNPPASTGYAEYVNNRLHAIAAGIGITYEQMTGDLSQVNYSSIRAGTLDFRREIEQFQWLTFIPMFCERVMTTWLNVAALTHNIKTDIEVEWTTPKWDWVDPVKDVKGEMMELALYLKSFSESSRKRGCDLELVLQEAEKDMKLFEKYNVPYPNIMDLLMRNNNELSK